MVLLLTLARAACGRDRGSMGANEAKDARPRSGSRTGRQGEGVRASDDGEPTASGPRQPTDGLHDLGSQTSLETAAREWVANSAAALTRFTKLRRLPRQASYATQSRTRRYDLRLTRSASCSTARICRIR
jgi:hypothetical protein